MEYIIIILMFHGILWAFLIARKVNILHDKITKELVWSFILLLLACSILWEIIYFFTPQEDNNN